MSDQWKNRIVIVTTGILLFSFSIACSVSVFSAATDNIPRPERFPAESAAANKIAITFFLFNFFFLSFLTASSHFVQYNIFFSVITIYNCKFLPVYFVFTLLACIFCIFFSLFTKK